MERKLRQIVSDWKKAEGEENKNELIRQIRDLLFKQQVKQKDEKVKKKISSRYSVVGGEIRIGQKVLMKKNHQVGEVREIKGKKAVVQLGMIPITVELGDLTVVEEK
jgi:DNA mismatch repair protein MutS2